MVYKKEAKFGEKLISQIEFKDALTTIHRLQNPEGEDLFILQCTWIQEFNLSKTAVTASGANPTILSKLPSYLSKIPSGSS